MARRSLRQRRPLQQTADSLAEYQYDEKGRLNPWAFEQVKYETYHQITGLSEEAIKAMMVEAVTEMVRIAILAMYKPFEELEVLGQMGDLQPSLDAKIDRLMHETAEGIRDSIDKSFSMLVTARERAPHYREGQNRLPYAMRRAILNANFVRVEGDRLIVGDVALLDREARHWHRLAFGAGEAGGDTSGLSIDVELGTSYTTLEIVDGPSPAFLMPPGRWVGPGMDSIPSYDGSKSAPLGRGKKGMGKGGGRYISGPIVNWSSARRALYASTPPDKRGLKTSSGDEFYPGGVPGWNGPKWIKTKGIAGRNFFFAGLRRAADDIPRGVEAVVAEVVREFIEKNAVTIERTMEDQG